MGDKPAAKKSPDMTALAIGKMAWRALLEEVYTTPKPGLVDRHSNGAHRDMDIRTFEKSAQALWPFFVLMAEQGRDLDSTEEELFCQIRRTGMDAEKAMYRATGGVNTHKGLIFTLGIYCAAAGRCLQKYGQVTERRLRQIQQDMTVRILTGELEQLSGKQAVSHGEQNLKHYGTTGVRGEAIAGYPAVWKFAMPTLRQGVKEGRDYNLVKLQTLFVLMSQVEDSNILARQNPETLRQVQQMATDFLKQGGAYAEEAYEKLIDLDAEMIRKNISAGGCADLLATAVFMNMLLDQAA